LGSRLPFGAGWVTLRLEFFRVFPKAFVEKTGPQENPGSVPKVTKEGPFMARIAAVKFVLTSLVLAAAMTGPLAQARSWPDRSVQSTAATIAVAELPRPGQVIFERIRVGGPFPHEKDGTVFGNREHALPAEKRGYYREYTVPTPGSRDRGARRIVCGGPARAPRACYYTADHYASFRMIVE